jgi:hypothetical protein
LRLIDLEKVTLYNLTKSTRKDGDPEESYDKISDYDAGVQYLDDSVAASIYGAEVTKTYRVSSLHFGLEQFLLPKINNNPDNLSKYLIEYLGNKFKIQRVTPKYIDMSWR